MWASLEGEMTLGLVPFVLAMLNRRMGRTLLRSLGSEVSSELKYQKDTLETVSKIWVTFENIYYLQLVTAEQLALSKHA